MNRYAFFKMAYNKDILTIYVEIQLKRSQVEKIENKNKISVGGISLFDYYKNKLHNKLVLKRSSSTTCEDNEDFQGMIDEYIKSI